jgi:hypothetical protein
MAYDQSAAGLLIMRVERQQEYLLITLTIDRQLAEGKVGQPPQQRLQLTDRAAALRTVTDFLDSF